MHDLNYTNRIWIKSYKKQYNNTIKKLNIGNEQFGKDKLHTNGKWHFEKKKHNNPSQPLTNNEYFNYNYAHFDNWPK